MRAMGSRSIQNWSLVLRPRVPQVDAERVLAVAVGHRLDQRRPLAGAGAVHRLAQHEVDLDAVVAVHGDAGDLVGRRPVRDLGDRRGVPIGGGERVLVVLADEDHRQLPHRRQVERFVEDALVGRAVAEEGDRHTVRPLQLGGEAGAGGERHGRAHDAVRAHDVELHVGDVHGAAEALAIAGLAAHQLRHHAVDARTLGDAVAVAAVVGGDDVVVAQRRADAGGDRLLALVAVGRALDDAFLEEVGGLVLEGADAAHGDVEIAERLRAYGDVAGCALVHRPSPPRACRFVPAGSLLSRHRPGAMLSRRLPALCPPGACRRYAVPAPAGAVPANAWPESLDGPEPSFRIHLQVPVGRLHGLSKSRSSFGRTHAKR